jgi:hypothetical protein
MLLVGARLASRADWTTAGRGTVRLRSTQGRAYRPGMRSLVAVSALLLTLVACGDDGGDNTTSSGEQPKVEKDESSAPEIVNVWGTFRADVFFGFDIRRNPDRCVAEDRDLADGVADAVIRDAEGAEIGLVNVAESGESPTYTDDGEEYYNTDVCEFAFTATVPRREGVYTIAWPELDVEERFTADNPGPIKVLFEDD